MTEILKTAQLDYPCFKQFRLIFQTRNFSLGEALVQNEVSWKTLRCFNDALESSQDRHEARSPSA